MSPKNFQMLLNKIQTIYIILFLLLSISPVVSIAETPTELAILKKELQKTDDDDRADYIGKQIEKRKEYLSNMARYNKKIISRSDDFISDRVKKIKDEVKTVQKMVSKLEKRQREYRQWYQDEITSRRSEIEKLEKKIAQVSDSERLSDLRKEIEIIEKKIDDLSGMPEMAWQAEAAQRYNDKITQLQQNLLFLPPSEEMMEVCMQRLFALNDLSAIEAELNGSYHSNLYMILTESLYIDNPDVVRASSVFTGNPLYILSVLRLSANRSLDPVIDKQRIQKSLFFLDTTFYTNDFSMLENDLAGMEAAIKVEMSEVFRSLSPLDTDDADRQKLLDDYYQGRINREVLIKAFHVIHVMGKMMIRKQKLFELYNSDLALDETLNQFINETAFLCLVMRYINEGTSINDLQSRTIKADYTQSLEDVTKIVLYYEYWNGLQEKQITE
jgi:uncharacterized protein YukE